MVDKSNASLINTKNYDVIKEHCIHYMTILTLLPLTHANVEINTFPMIYYKGSVIRIKDITHNFILYNISLAYFSKTIYSLVSKTYVILWTLNVNLRHNEYIHLLPGVCSMC